MGTSGLAYVEAVKLGVTDPAHRQPPDGQRPLGALDRERRPQPRADGPRALASTQSLLAPVDEHFRRVGQAAGYLVDQVSEYDLFNVTHQVPGGMVGTLQGSARAARDERPPRRGAGGDGRGARASSAGP